jgi:thiol:disulfide interchange protein DsbA
MKQTLLPSYIKAIVFTLAGLFLLACSDKQFEQGTHYTTFNNALDDVIVNHPELKQTQVSEFFTYGCSHCQAFAPVLSKWGKSKEINIKYVPIVWNETTDLHARAYFLIESHQNFSSLHSGLFTLVAGFSRTDSLDDQKIELITWLQKQNIQPIDALNAFNSTGFENELALSVLLAKRFQVTGTPTLVINNTYRINNKSMSSQKDLLTVAEELLDN